MATRNKWRQSTRSKIIDLYHVKPMMIAAFGLTIFLFAALFLLPYVPNWVSFIGGILAGAIDFILWYSWRAEQ